MTQDNIPVDVDANVFYQVQDETAAVLNVDEYYVATQLSARAAVRGMMGKSTLDELLSERQKIGGRLREHISEFTSR